MEPCLGIFFFNIERICVCVWKGRGQISRIDYIYICLLRRRIARNVRLIVSSVQNL